MYWMVHKEKTETKSSVYYIYLLAFRTDIFYLLISDPHEVSSLYNSTFEENTKENVTDTYGKSNIWRYKMI